MVMRSVLFPLLLWALLLTASHGNKFDEDTGTECQAKAEKDYCLKDPQAYFDCPSTCALHLRPRSFTFGAFEKIDGPFFKFNLKELAPSDKVVNFEDFDGEITIVSLIPLHPGMAQFHYNLLDHMLDVYKYVLNVVVIPMPGTDGVSITPREGSSVHILDPEDNKLVQYLKNKITKMNADRFDEANLNSFVISYDARHISMHVYPDMQEYRKFIEDQLEQMENEL